jgi:hypothetical protein
MAFSKDWSERWRRFLAPPPSGDRKALDILRQRYVEEMQAAGRFKQHAQEMQSVSRKTSPDRDGKK